MAEIEKFSEGEEALALAAAEEERLKKEANDRIAALGVRDPMLDDAVEIWENVEKEKHNDHGKPWKKPPPVQFSPEYWKEWKQKVKVRRDGTTLEGKQHCHLKIEAWTLTRH